MIQVTASMIDGICSRIPLLVTILNMSISYTMIRYNRFCLPAVLVRIRTMYVRTERHILCVILLQVRLAALMSYTHSCLYTTRQYICLHDTLKGTLVKINQMSQTSNTVWILQSRYSFTGTHVTSYTPVICTCQVTCTLQGCIISYPVTGKQMNYQYAALMFC